MSHTHALHALRALSSPVLKQIMDDTQPSAERLRTMADQLDGKLEAGNFRRLPQCERVEIRALVFALHDVADKMEPAPRSRAGWWDRFLGRVA